MIRTVAQKMGVRPGCRVALVGDPPGIRDGLGLPEVRWTADLSEQVEHLQVFTTTRADLDAGFPAWRDRLAVGGRLWVSWPKGRGLGTDLTLPEVIKIGYRHSLVESTTLSIDRVWSAIRFTRPKRGVTYRNSYGTLPEDVIASLGRPG